MELDVFKQNLKNCSHLSVIFQLTDKCVLACKYCFARGAHLGDNPKFSSELLEKVISQAFMTHHSAITFEWTGGEAFLMGKDFFVRVLEIQRKYATKPFKNCVQTSGYLFDKELIDFLVENQFDVSLTIDGTEEIHNANRPTQNETESFRQVLATRNYLKEKTGDCGFIVTVTRNNLGHEKEMLDFFRELGGLYTFHSNPYIYFDKNIVKDESLAIDNEDYARYFIAQFNSWYESGVEIPIPHTVDYFMKALVTGKAAHRTLCIFGGRCLTNFIAITPNGDCYNCPKFTGHPNMKIGNVYETDLPELLEPDKNERMSLLISQRMEAIKKCEESGCKYMYICNGGCPYLSYLGGNGESISEKDCMCEGKTTVMEYLESIKNAIIEIEQEE